MLDRSHHQLVSDLIGSDLIIGDKIRFQVTSDSMKPFIRNGDTIIAEVIDSQNVNRGDLIVIKRVDDFLTHRAITLVNNKWLTKGDNNTFPDPLVKPENIVGRVKIIQYSGKKINFEENKWIYLNPLLAKLGELETRAFSHHHYFRQPFRIIMKCFQVFLK